LKTRSERAIDRLKINLLKPLDKRRRSFFVAQPPAGRRFVITDIHGCYQTFVKLLHKIDLKKYDQLFIIGDMIDRGPYSYLVLDKIWQLLDRGYQIFPLRGNHEQLFLDFNRENTRKLISFASRQYAAHLIESSGSLNSDVDKFFGNLPVYYETDKAFLVHAGFDTSQKNPFDAWKDMIWVRKFSYSETKLAGKRVIHGHVPTNLSAITESIQKGEKIINLDNGCIRASAEGFGKLLCFDLDSEELFSQKNIDFLPV